MSTLNEYWKWLEEDFIGKIRAQQWYNGESSRNLSGFINDKSNRLIGWPTMRQLRMKSHRCSYEKLRLNCVEDYHSSNEETNSFLPQWINETIDKYSSTVIQSFEYRTKNELDTYVSIGDHGSYNGNGYVYEFRGRLNEIRRNVSELHQLKWIDNYTRVVIIQMNLYNPNIQLFTSMIFLVEFLSNGGIYPTARFEPFHFQAFTSQIQMISTIIYMILIVYFIVNEMQLFIHLKRSYFHRFQSYIELSLIILSWTTVGINIWRHQESKRIGKLFRETNGYVYINLQFASYVNDLLTYVLGLCCFFGTIKLTYLCRYNRRLLLFSETLRMGGKELILFSMMFSVIFFAFLCLFYFLFNSHLQSCSSLIQTARMLFEMSLMKFDAHQLIDANAFLGPFSFTLFILIVVFVCMSMFLSIINRSFQQARDQNNHRNDEQIFSFMIDKFLRWTGLRKPTTIEILEERDARMRQEYFDPIERFPERMDQLLNAINRLYLQQISGRI